MPRRRLKKTVLLVLKLAISLGLLSYLFVQAQRDQSFVVLRDQPKHWMFLATALALTLLGVAMTFFRWYLLVRALDLPFRLSDALRLGFLGYLFNFVSLGSVGGDLFKAIFLAREQRGRRTEAVATVVIDRLVGFYCLLLLTSTAAVVAGLLADTQPAQLRTIARTALVGTAVGAIGIALGFVPGVIRGSVASRIMVLPGVGPTAARLIAALRVYQRKYPVVLLAGAISLVVQALFALVIYLIACGLPGHAPALGRHFVIVPLSMAVGALPLPFAGLGAFEGALEFLYRCSAGDVPVARGHGLIVALGYRLITLVVALVGVCYYLASRREVDEAIRTAEVVET